MTQFPKDEEKLVAFVRRYRPVPPPMAVDLENRLMESVNSSPYPGQKRPPQLFWLIPSALAAGLLLAWGIHQRFTPTPQLTATSGDEELEAFLVDSWQGSLAETAFVSQTQISEWDWLLLPESQANYSLSSP